MGLWELTVYPFYSLAGGMANFLLLRRPMSFLFAGWTRSSNLHYVLAIMFSPPLRADLFSPRRQGWLGSVRRRPWQRRWKPGLGRLPRFFFSWLALPSNSYRLFWGFLWIPISSGRFLGDEGWLNISNSSADSVRSTKPSSFCSSSSSSSS